MSERVIPGVSIREITEGLIGVPTPGSTAVKLVGTACKGSDEPQYFSNITDIKEEYGAADPYQYSTSTGTNPPMELTLVRAAELLYKNPPPGGVWIQRVIGSDAVTAIAAGITATSVTFSMTAYEEGSWYNNFAYKFYNNKNAAGSSETGTSTFWLRIPSSSMIDTNITTFAGASNNQFYEKGIEFEIISQTNGSTAVVSDIVSQWNTSAMTGYFTMSVGTSTGTAISDQTTWGSIFTSGDTAGTNWSTNDQTYATAGLYSNALEQLRTKENCYMTIIAGCDDTTRFPSVAAEGQAHVNAASLEKNEQSFLVGSDNDTNKTSFITNLLTSTTYSGFSNGRVIKVAPGMKMGNPYAGQGTTWTLGSTISTVSEITVSGGYVSAMVAGLIAQQVPDESPMNKPLSYSGNGLEHELTISDQKRLVRDNWFLLVKGQGYRTLRDLTTAGVADPFFHVSTRMAVDEIKRALRMSGNPWIGKKNIVRNRSGMKRSLEEVCKQRVNREIISADYELTVSSSRTEQIIGAVKVKLLILLVFYMEFIEIDLVLG